MSIFGDSIAGLALLTSVVSAFYSKRANDRAALRDKPPVYFEARGNDLLLLNVGQERISAIEWKEDDSSKERAVLDPGDCQRVADMFSFIFNAPAKVAVYFDYPSSRRWKTQIEWDGGKAGKLRWSTAPVR